ncbi:hypothetical protein [Serratia sp. UGAL515B_01]|uniref:hypothetical protein n=1 Tax=Serratia sp. UGAL515B_01 TaxID=2986763 RepID=UPI00295470E9|nr:hypothetical protein [Serratia sp. UGAL515B_01]WON77561.1 hypothetical protein OK023_02310 [Serratia sp. UGAL515B_01]
MKSTFVHECITTEEAIHLMECYRRTGAKAERTLNATDKTRWDVAVERDEVRYLPPTPYSMINRSWR